MFEDWFRFAADTTMLALEAQGVVGLRLAQVAVGRGTPAELSLMVTEKVEALQEAGRILLAGGSPHMVVVDYRDRVEANTRRLRDATAR